MSISVLCPLLFYCSLSVCLINSFILDENDIIIRFFCYIITCVKQHLLEAGVSFKGHVRSSNVIILNVIKCQFTT